MSDKTFIKVDLSVVSSIMHFAGHEGLLCYLSLETYKTFKKDEYLTHDMLGEFGFIKLDSSWTRHMNLLVDMKLATRNGDHFITRRKLKDWRVFASQTTPQSLEFNGYIYFNMSQLYRRRNECKNLRDLIYLSLVDNLARGKSISRPFIRKLTGISKFVQRNIEKKYNDIYIQKREHHIPLSDKEVDKQNTPVFHGQFRPNELKCGKSLKSKSNCKVIQLGNKLKIKDLNISYFKNKKVKSKSMSPSKNPNKSLPNDEVCDWEKFDMVFDESDDSKSNKFKGILSVNDPRKMSWKDFNHYDYDTVKVLSKKGCFENLRNILNS